MKFKTKVSFVECWCNVTHVEPSLDGVYWFAPDACFPDEEAGFDFEIVDGDGKRLRYLEKRLTDDDTERLFNEFKAYAQDLAYDSY